MASGWQMERIRRRLNNYRDKERIGKRPLPISGVLDNMVARLCVDEALVSESQIRSIDNETMRRFCEGAQALQPKRLEFVKQFLILEGMLDEAELTDDGGDQGELFALHSYLADVSPSAKASLAELYDFYASNVGEVADAVTIELMLHPDPSGSFFRAEEHFVQRGAPAATARMRHDSTPRLNGFRKGYGFLSTDASLLHVFLRGASARDRVHYIEQPLASSRLAPFLFRAGGQLIDPAPLGEDQEQDVALAGRSVYRFGPGCSLERRREQFATNRPEAGRPA